jgi:hypothetical protein
MRHSCANYQSMPKGRVLIYTELSVHPKNCPTLTKNLFEPLNHWRG